MITIRTVERPDDLMALSTLDTSFTTDRIYRPVQEEMSFRLVEERVSPPLRKQYSLDPFDPVERQDWEYTAIAEEEGRLAGFAAAQYVAWNRRVILLHLYVTPHSRGQGVGTWLLEAVDAFARSAGARCLWLETQNVNYPAIQFYRHAGFSFCGFDASLYDPDALPQEEVALFFTRPFTTPRRPTIAG